MVQPKKITVVAIVHHCFNLPLCCRLHCLTMFNSDSTVPSLHATERRTPLRSGQHQQHESQERHHTATTVTSDLLTQLDPDTRSHILSFLTMIDVAQSCMLVCKSWYYTIWHESHTQWQHPPFLIRPMHDALFYNNDNAQHGEHDNKSIPTRRKHRDFQEAHFDLYRKWCTRVTTWSFYCPCVHEKDSIQSASWWNHVYEQLASVMSCATRLKFLAEPMIATNKKNNQNHPFINNKPCIVNQSLSDASPFSWFNKFTHVNTIHLYKDSTNPFTTSLSVASQPWNHEKQNNDHPADTIPFLSRIKHLKLVDVDQDTMIACLENMGPLESLKIVHSGCYSSDDEYWLCAERALMRHAKTLRKFTWIEGTSLTGTLGTTLPMRCVDLSVFLHACSQLRSIHIYNDANRDESSWCTYHEKDGCLTLLEDTTIYTLHGYCFHQWHLHSMMRQLRICVQTYNVCPQYLTLADLRFSTPALRTLHVQCDCIHPRSSSSSLYNPTFMVGCFEWVMLTQLHTLCITGPIIIPYSAGYQSVQPCTSLRVLSLPLMDMHSLRHGINWINQMTYLFPCVTSITLDMSTRTFKEYLFLLLLYALHRFSCAITWTVIVNEKFYESHLGAQYYCSSTPCFSTCCCHFPSMQRQQCSNDDPKHNTDITTCMHNLALPCDTISNDDIIPRDDNKDHPYMIANNHTPLSDSPWCVERWPAASSIQQVRVYRRQRWQQQLRTLQTGPSWNISLLFQWLLFKNVVTPPRIHRPPHSPLHYVKTRHESWKRICALPYHERLCQARLFKTCHGLLEHIKLIMPSALHHE